MGEVHDFFKEGLMRRGVLWLRGIKERALRQLWGESDPTERSRAHARRKKVDDAAK
jgi:hypothetical protein